MVHLMRTFLFVAVSFFSWMRALDFVREIQSNCTQAECQQDIIVNGKSISTSKYSHYLGQRYAAIKTVLEKYQRPFTLLELGATQGYYSLRSSHDFSQSTCVMWEDGVSRYKGAVSTESINLLKRICILNSEQKNMIFLSEAQEIKNIIELSECEHFDVTLALDLFNRFPTNFTYYRQYITALMALGDHLIIAVPATHKNFYPKVRDYIKHSLKGTTLLVDDKFEIYMISHPKKILKKGGWKTTSNHRNYTVVSNFKEKRIVKKTGSETWNAGITLRTFYYLKGEFPLKSTIKRIVLDLGQSNHGDMLPNNIVLQGQTAVLIDWDSQVLPVSEATRIIFDMFGLASVNPDPA